MIFKMIVINGLQDWVSKRKWSFKFKMFVYIMVFIGNLTYNTRQFIEKRSDTLYDLFEISRLADFEEIK